MDDVFQDEEERYRYNVNHDASGTHYRGHCCRFSYIISIDLLISKVYYFFFWGAIGCILPFLGIYFKQLGLSPLQCGLLIGIRPFIDTFGAILCSHIAHKKRINRIILLISILAWAVVTLSLSFFVPNRHSCPADNEAHSNWTTVELPSITPSVITNDTSYNVVNVSESLNSTNNQPASTPAVIQVVTSSSQAISNHDHHDHSTSFQSTSSYSAKPKQSSDASDGIEQERNPRIRSIPSGYWPHPNLFLYLIVISGIGQIFASPAQTLSDVATLAYLGQSVDKFGHQRLWGSLGWCLATLLISVLLEDNYSIIPWCNTSHFGRNYQICFYSFLVMMVLAFLVATQFKFKLNNASIDTYALHLADENMAFLYDRRLNPAGIFQLFATSRMISFFIILWFLGCCYGVLFTFLYWYLEDYGGTPLLFGIATLINQNSELLGYFLSDRLINSTGPIRLIYVALIANAIRFLYISSVQQAWLVLPVEILQGLTHALVWSASISYVHKEVPQHQFPKAIGLLQSIYHGFGMANGAFIAGLLIHYYDTAIVFRAYGVISIILLISFGAIQYLIRRHDDKLRREEQANSVSYDRLRLPSLEEEFEELLEDDEPITFRELSVMEVNHSNRPNGKISGI